MNFKYFSLQGLAIVTTLAFNACTQDSLELDVNAYAEMQEPTEYVYTMHWDAPCPGFDDGETRAVSKSWDNGSVLYVRFKSGTSWISGTATYSTSSGEWTISTNSSVPTTTSNTACEMYYFQNPSKVETSQVTLSESTATFKCTGSYTHPSASEFYITGTLEPVVWRLRFQGSNGTAVTLSDANDIQYFTTFNRSSGNLTLAKKNVSMSVKSGYTPYIYGTFVSPNGSNTLRVETSAASGYFEKKIQGSKLQVKGSGVLTLPTEGNYATYGWAYKRIAQNCEATIVNPCCFIDGIIMQFELGSNAANFYYDGYEKTYAESHSDDELIAELIKSDPFTSDDAKYTFRSLSANFYSPNTEYYICSVAKNSDGDYGNVLRYKFKTLASNVPIAKLSNLKASTNSGSPVWSWDVALNNGCKSYYLYADEDPDDYSDEEHWTAYYMYKAIKDGDLTRTYDYESVYISKSGSSIYVYTWAVDAQGNIGNYSTAKTTASSSVKAGVSENHTEAMKNNILRKGNLVEKPRTITLVRNFNQ